MLYYRVHPYKKSAKTGQRGHPLFVPGNQGRGRIDNPTEYRSLYVSESKVGALVEIFGDHAVWTPDLFLGPKALPGSKMVLTSYEGDLHLTDLDDPIELVAIDVRPSRVVTRHRTVTQSWALALFQNRPGSHGVKWWSYHEPESSSVGLWDFSSLTPVASETLHEKHPSVIMARNMLARPWES